MSRELYSLEAKLEAIEKGEEVSFEDDGSGDDSDVPTATLVTKKKAEQEA